VSGEGPLIMQSSGRFAVVTLAILSLANVRASSMLHSAERPPPYGTYAHRKYHKKNLWCESAAPVFHRLHIESLWYTLLLLVQDLLLCLAEIRLRHAHASLAQRQQPRLGAHGLDVGAAQLVLRTRSTRIDGHWSAATTHFHH